MNPLTLSLANIRTQLAGTLLTLLLLTLGVATIVVLMLLNAQLRERLERDVAGIDLVVGAKGSPLQLILSSVYHIDVPTGNIPIAQADLIAQNPMVAAAIPLALGDSSDGFRIVGTTPDYLSLYAAELERGKLWSEPMQLVLGAEVALRTGHDIGDRIIGAHGLGHGGQAHADMPYQVAGVLKPTGSTLDRLILTSVDSVHKVHEGHAGQQNPVLAAAGAAGNPAEEITALLIRYRTPLAAVTLPRLINAQSALQAAAPAFELARLLQLVGTGADILRGFAYVLIIVAALSIFVALYSALQKRQFDLAVMRTLGASRGQVLWFILLEGLLLAVGGTLIGILCGHLATAAVAWWLLETRQIFFSAGSWLPQELYLPLLAIVIGVLAALLPAIQAYRLDIATVLAEHQG
jgi:putative ABC transport system permease protein